MTIANRVASRVLKASDPTLQELVGAAHVRFLLSVAKTLGQMIEKRATPTGPHFRNLKGNARASEVTFDMGSEEFAMLILGPNVTLASNRLGPFDVPAQGTPASTAARLATALFAAWDKKYPPR